MGGFLSPRLLRCAVWERVSVVRWHEGWAVKSACAFGPSRVPANDTHEFPHTHRNNRGREPPASRSTNNADRHCDTKTSFCRALLSIGPCEHYPTRFEILNSETCVVSWCVVCVCVCGVCVIDGRQQHREEREELRE